MLGDLLVSAQQAAHKWLREMILSGELPAGQALRQEEIARRLGISRLPIREALNRLATEGPGRAQAAPWLLRGVPEYR